MSYSRESAFFFSDSEDRKRFFRRMAIRDYRFLIWLRLVAPLCLLMVCVGLASGFYGEAPRYLFAGMRSEYPLLTAVLDFVSDYADNVIFVVYLGVLVQAIAAKDRCKQVFFFRFFVGLAGVLLLVSLVKGLCGIPRPGIPLPAAPLSFSTHFGSFPSAYTAQIVALALPLVFFFRKRWLHIAMPVVITLVGFARLWLGKHHPVDIVGGVFFGSLILFFMFRKARCAL